ncbi:predicted protein [Uncinocarpus reesii 1704]|uniref:Retrotransposon gag domain-containing protein n=1 Tax=Uncinocarpus reesii (strain UAMH 1704) TaxID=336963 RepID=C4JUD2_UNCRE|nr:uncharacterized protein UREG_06071 [Uncinocarpus reesii 1704]EEP81229.1 predicted protein [Uncinocarpus reesii 1704]
MLKVINHYKIFIKTLKITFEEVEEQNAATQQLQNMWQKTSPQEYAMRFQQVCINTDWDNEALADTFYQGLFNNMNNKTTCMEKQPQNLTGMIKVTVRIGN